METLTIIAAAAAFGLGYIIGSEVRETRSNKILTRIAELRLEGYISPVPAEPMPPTNDFWTDIPEG